MCVMNTDDLSQNNTPYNYLNTAERGKEEVPRGLPTAAPPLFHFFRLYIRPTWCGGGGFSEMHIHPPRDKVEGDLI